MTPFEGYHYPFSLTDLAISEGWTVNTPKRKPKTDGAFGQGKPKQNKSGTKLQKKLKRKRE